ncbi:MAG: hypothetical protein DRN92_01990 [Thermoproteota archaeon]|nr:MAG: hypothetical protein DRN92_01990 [Candidatus Korarchaeota archaeon]
MGILREEEYMALTSRIKFPRGFDRDLKLVLASLACRRVVMGFLEVVRAIYFAFLGLSPAQIGILFMIPIALGAVRSILFGLLADRYGSKIFIVIGNVFSTLRLVIYIFSKEYWMLALAQAIGAFGEGGGPGQPSVSALITDKTSPEVRTHVFSTLAFTNAAAATLGSMMAGLPVLFEKKLNIGTISSYGLLFWIGVIFSSLATFLVIPIKEKRSKEEMGRKARGLLPKKSWGVIGKFSLVRCIGGLGFGMISPLLPLYFYMKFSTGPEILGPFYAVSRFISMFSYLFIDKIVSIMGEVGSIVMSRLVSLVGILLLPIAPNYYVGGALIVLFRTILLFTMPVRQSFITLIVDPSESASAVGISNTARMAVRSVAPAVAGYMFEGISLNLPFFLGGMLVGLNALLYHVFFGRKEVSSSRTNNS